MHDTEDFFEGSFAGEGAEGAVHEHGDHAVSYGGFFEFEIESAVHDEMLDIFVELEHLTQDETFFVSGVAALFASVCCPHIVRDVWNSDAGFLSEQSEDFCDGFAESAVEWRALFAIAEFTDEALCHIGATGIHNIVGAHAHGDEAWDAPGGIVGVKSGDDEVSGEGGLEGDLGSFVIADFADHDDVGILAEERAECG